MREDISSAFRISVLVAMIVAFVVIALNILIISNSLLKSGKTTLTKAIEETSKEEIKGIAIKEDGSVSLIKGPRKTVEKLSFSLIFDHVFGDYTKEELREWGNSYTPSQWFKWAIWFSVKIIIAGLLLLLIAPTLGSYLIYRFCKSKYNVGGIVDADWREENINNCNRDSGLWQD